MMENSSKTANETLDGFAFVNWVINEHQKYGDPVRELLRAAKGHESDWLELKAAVYPSEKDDPEYRKLLEETPVEQLKGAKNLYRNEICKEIAAAVVAIHNSRGGAVLIGVDNGGHAVPLLENHDEGFSPSGDELEEYFRRTIQGKILGTSGGSAKKRFSCRKDNWEIPVGSIEVTWKELRLDGAPVVALLVPPLDPEKRPLVAEASEKGKGGKRHVLLKRTPGDIGQTQKRTVEMDWRDDGAYWEDYFRDRKKLFFDNGDLARLRYELSLVIPFAVDPVRTPNFVGRDKELPELHRLLSEGKIPVVTGPGGTGKTELLLQYAELHKADYPGGLFQFDMEKAKSWNDAFLQSPETVRRIPDSDDNALNSSEDVIRSLRRRTERDGRILLVLDNVVSVRSFLWGPSLETLSLPRDVCMIATARTVDVIFRPTDRAVEYQLSDLSPDAALKLLTKDNPADSAAERVAAENVARLLGFRALYLRSVPALLNDPYSMHKGSYVSLEAALRENLRETVDSAMENYGEGGRTPTVLWKLTRAELSRRPGGPDWIALAQAAAFFAPVGFRSAVLRHLWGSLVRPESNTERLYRQALDVLRRHGIIYETGAGRFSMHRLTSEALRLFENSFRSDMEETIGLSLARFDGMSPVDWLSLADHVSILRFIPQYSLLSRRPKYYRHGLKVSSLQVQLLLHNPELSTIIHWESFHEKDWRELLVDRPQFFDRCPRNAIDVRTWIALLCKQPRLAEECPWDKLSGYDWAVLLANQPQFADRCLWSELGGYDWAILLANQPQFADRCPWNELGGDDWATLLGKQPQFADRCPWNKLGGSDWAQLLRCKPQFAKDCPWEMILINWGFLLNAQPQFANHCPWKSLSFFDWEVLLAGSPQFSGRCPWNRLVEFLTGLDWACLLSDQPQFADHCPWNELGGYDWAILLGNQPQFANHCPWDVLDNGDWLFLLDRRPQFAEQCLKSNSVGTGWAIVLCFLPDRAEHCPWDSLDGADWGLLLWEQPQFSDRCPWDCLDGGSWAPLLGGQPQLAPHCRWEKLNGDDWVLLLRNQPQFTERCPWEKLDDDNWKALLSVQPQLAIHRTSFSP